MRKYYGIVILAVTMLVLIAGSQFDKMTAASVFAPLNKAMEATGATTRQLGLNAWVELPRSDLTDEQMTEFVTYVMGRLGYGPGQYNLALSRSERHRVVRAEALVNRLHVVVLAQVVYPIWEQKASQAYLSVVVEAEAADGSAAEWIDRVQDAVAGFGGTPRITTCLVGWLDGKLDKDEWVSRLHNASNMVNTVVSTTVIQPGYASISGFSPALPEGIKAGDKQVNVNMAIRYSPLDNRTYIIIGSPVIFGEY